LINYNFSMPEPIVTLLNALERSLEKVVCYYY
jgi:hypothetical protein